MTPPRRREVLIDPSGLGMRAHVTRFAGRSGVDIITAGGVIADVQDHVARRVVIGIGPSVAWLTPNTARRLVLAIEAAIRDADNEARR